MTLLSIADAVADETKGPKPATIASNPDPAAENIFRLINKVGTRLMQEYTWNILTKEETVTAPVAVTLVAAASMPAGFNRIIPETMLDRGINSLLPGPISGGDRQGWKGLTDWTRNKQ